MEQLVPENEKCWPLRSWILFSQIVTVPESPHRMASSARTSGKCHCMTCGFIGIASLVPCLETGKRGAQAATGRKLAEALGVPPGELVGEEVRR